MVNSVLPKLIAFKSVLVIRDIQLRKADEEKKEREKAEREGRALPPEKNKDMMKMTPEEFIAF